MSLKKSIGTFTLMYRVDWSKKFNNQIGTIHLLLLFTTVGILSFILVLSLGQLSQEVHVYAASTFTNLSPAADAYVRQDQPSTNFGLSTSLQVDGSPIKISYFKFNLSNVSSTNLISAKLRLKIIDSSTSTQNVKLVDDTSWSETTINNNNKPALGPVQNAFKGGVSGNWLEIDLTQVVIAKVGQLLSLGIDSVGSDGIDFNSKEAISSDRPVLVLEYQSTEPSPTPTPTSIPTSTPAPTATPTPTPTSAPTPTPLPGTDPVIAAAGDIACDPSSGSFNGGAGSSSSCHMRATSDVIVNINPQAVLSLGDNQYECGSLSAFQQSYDLSWGRFKSIIHPAVGNHEYLTSGGTGCDATNSGAAGHFNYFGPEAGDPTKGYYSYDIGSWHLIVLNSNCSKAGGCAVGSAQEQWLRADLAAHPTTCTLAYWHHARFSSGSHGNNTTTTALLQALYDFNADLLLVAHDHDYERFALQDPSGNADPTRGIRQFVVGTGGRNHKGLGAAGRIVNSEIFDSTSFGVLKLILHPVGYDWQFMPTPGSSFTDSGSQTCH